MSSLLKEAIVDANALKAAALKNAESAIIAKYSNEVKDTIDKLLEQDELGLELGGDLSGEEMGDPGMGEDPAVADAEDPMMDLGGDPAAMGAEPMQEVEEVTEDDIPLGAANGLSKEVGINLQEAPNEGEEVEFNVDLGALHEAIQELRSELEEDEEIEINEEDLVAMLEDDDEQPNPESAEGTYVKSPQEVESDVEQTLEEDQEDLEELTVAPTGSRPDTPHQLGKKRPKKAPKKAQVPTAPTAAQLPEAETLASQGNAHYKQKPAGEESEDKPKKKNHPPGPKKKTGWEGVTVDDITMGGKYGTNEGVEITEEMVDAIMEKLTVDMGATLSGWAGRSSESMRWEIEKALAHRRSSDFEEDFEDLKKAHDELVFENNQLKGHTKQYQQTLTKLKESLQDINLSNARLLYTNRVLRNTSLNERQKEKIVEAISNAGSVTEAKTIYNTLQSTMETKRTKRSPQSLSEAIGRNPSFIRASRTESKPVDVFSERMKKLAGIK
jgi:tetratricopeptide (TPR) repeat protein